jgi:hypothetical protein
VKTTKIALGVVLAVAIALLAGWLWGASGRRAAEHDLAAASLRDDLLEARTSVLAARVDLYNVNFGNASRHLQEALERLTPVSQQIKDLGRPEDAARVDRARTQTQEAQRLAAKLDQGANARAADAAAALDEVLQAGAKR